MPIQEGRVRTSTGFANVNFPLTAIRPVYDAVGALTAVNVELKAVFDDGLPSMVTVDLMSLLTAAQRTTLNNLLVAIATRVANYLA